MCGNIGNIIVFYSNSFFSFCSAVKCVKMTVKKDWMMVGLFLCDSSDHLFSHKKTEWHLNDTQMIAHFSMYVNMVHLDAIHTIWDKYVSLNVTMIESHFAKSNGWNVRKRKRTRIISQHAISKRSEIKVWFEEKNIYTEKNTISKIWKFHHLKWYWTQEITACKGFYHMPYSQT